MFTKVSTFLALIMLVTACAMADEADKKLATLTAVQSAYADLIKLASKCNAGECGPRASPDQAQIGREVRRIVQGIDSSEALLRLSILSYASAYPQNAGGQRVDLVFDSAWTQSVRRLCDAPDGMEALQSLQHMLKTDGSNSLLIKECMERSGRLSRVESTPPAKPQEL